MKEQMNSTQELVVEYIINGERRLHTVNTVDEGLRVVHTLKDAILKVNGIIMPETEDETFFYASVKAAEEGKVWLEEKHGFVTSEEFSAVRGGCADDDEEAVEKFWEEAINNVYADIYGYKPVTREDGEALVEDKDLAEECEKEGYIVVHLHGADLSPSGEPNEFWIIYAPEEEQPIDPEPADEYLPDFLFNEDESTKVEPLVDWEEDRGTRELFYESEKVHAYWDQYDDEGSIFLGEPNENFGGFKISAHAEGIKTLGFLEQIICAINEDPDSIKIVDGEVYRKTDNPFAPTGWEFLRDGEEWVLEDEVVGEITRLKKGGVTFDEDDVKPRWESCHLDGGLEPDEPLAAPTQPVLDMQRAIREIVRYGFTVDRYPTFGDLPFVGYSVNEDTGEVVTTFFTEGVRVGDVIEFEDISGYSARSDEFLGWKSMRGSSPRL